MGIQKYNSGVQVNKSKTSDTSTTATNANTATTANSAKGLLGSALGTTKVGMLPTYATDTSISWQGYAPGIIGDTNGFILTGYTDKIASSTDGITWKLSTSPLAGPTFSAYGKGIFVIVSGGSSSSYVSADGVTWTAGGALPSSSNWQSLTYGNGVFVSLASNSSIAATSTDGLTWTQRTLPSTSFWSSVAYGNGTFVAVQNSASTAAASSTDGITWTARALPSSSSWTSVTYGNGTFVAVQSGGSTAAASSTDGVTWTARVMPSAAQWGSVTYGNGLFVASSYSGGAASSTDGITWTARALSQPADSGSWGPIVYGNGFFIISGWYSGYSTRSTDAITWTQSSIGLNTDWRSIAVWNKPIDYRINVGDLQEVITNIAYTVGSYDKWINIASTAAHTITLPAPALNKNRELVIKQTAAFTVSSASSNVKPLTTQVAGTAILSGAGKYAKLISNGTHWVIMEAN